MSRKILPSLPKGKNRTSSFSEHNTQLTTVLSHDICCDFFENKNRLNKKHSKTKKQTNRQTDRKTFSKILCGGLSSNLLRIGLSFTSQRIVQIFHQEEGRVSKNFAHTNQLTPATPTAGPINNS